MTHTAITIHIRYYSLIRKHAGVKQEDITLEQKTRITFAGFIKHLSARHGQAFQRLVLDENGNPNRQLVIYFNGEPVWSTRWDEVIEQSGDLALFSPVGGG